jgi:hypothetical protein
MTIRSTRFGANSKVPPTNIRTALFKPGHSPQCKTLSRQLKTTARSKGERNESYVLPTLVPHRSLASRA